MKKLTPFFLTILLGLNSCSDGLRNMKENSSINFKIPVVTDSSVPNRKDYESMWLDDCRYNPIYIGKYLDTINPSSPAEINKYFVYDRYHNLDSLGINIIIDTNKIISYPARTLSSQFNGYPVFIVNTVKDTLYIGYGMHIPLIMEAIDSNGKWKPIEEPFMYMCGTGLNEIILPPNEIVFTSAPKFTGKFKTKLRLRYSNILSYEFNGEINISQFESRYDENGNIKPLLKE